MTELTLKQRLIESAFDFGLNKMIFIDRGYRTKKAPSLEVLDGDNFDEYDEPE